MKILSFSPNDDTGGFGYRQASAFDQYGPAGWEYRAVRQRPSYLQFPAHDEWDWDQIRQWWADADVIHVYDYYTHDVGPHRPTVMTFHGTGFREDPQGSLEYAASWGARPLVSTLDLWLLAPDETTWAPQIDDLDWLATYRAPNTGPLRICHAPTNRALKSTDAFLTACERLAQDVDIEVALIEGKTWAEALTLKGTCDIVFDQTLYGYGGNALEAWAMGIPVVCGAADTTLTEYERRFGAIPFVIADDGNIYDALLSLTSKTRRNVWGRIGRDHAEHHHSYQVGVERLTTIYTEVAGG